MKNIFEYSDEELLELTSEQIDAIIDYHCAINNIPLLPEHPGPTPERPHIPAPTFFEIGDFYVEEFEEAAAIFTVLKNVKLYKKEGWGSSGRLVPLIPGMHGYPQIQTICDIPLEDVWKSYQTGQTDFDKTSQEWADKREVYEAIENRRSEVSSLVRDSILAAHKRKLKFEELQNQFKHYIVIAKGDQKMALNFLCNTQTVTTEQKDILLPGWNLEDKHVSSDN